MIKDNNNKNNGIYFTDSPFNILSVTELAESIKDDKIRWDLTKRKYFISIWGLDKYKNTIAQ